MKIKNKDIDVKLLNKFGNFIRENGSTISMVGGLVALVGALYCAFKAADDVSEVGEDYAEKVEEIERSAVKGDEKDKLIKEAKSMRNMRYILAYKWALLFGCTSAGLIFLTKYLDGIAISGLAAVAMAKQDELKSFVDRTKEFVGEDKFKEIEEKTLEDKVLRNFVKDGENVALKPYARGGTIFVDTESGAIFQMNERDLTAVLEHAEDYCARNHYLYQDKFFDMIGVEPPEEKIPKIRRWGPENPFKAHIGTQTCFGATFKSIEYDYRPVNISKH